TVQSAGGQAARRSHERRNGGRVVIAGRNRGRQRTRGRAPATADDPCLANVMALVERYIASADFDVAEETLRKLNFEGWRADSVRAVMRTVMEHAPSDD